MTQIFPELAMFFFLLLFFNTFLTLLPHFNLLAVVLDSERFNTYARINLNLVLG